MVNLIEASVDAMIAQDAIHRIDTGRSMTRGKPMLRVYDEAKRDMKVSSPGKMGPDAYSSLFSNAEVLECVREDGYTVDEFGEYSDQGQLTYWPNGWSVS